MNTVNSVTSPDTYALLDFVLTRTETPPMRLTAIGGYVNLLKQALDKGLETGTFQESTLPLIKTMRSACDAFVESPASTFVEWAVKLYDMVAAARSGGGSSKVTPAQEAAYQLYFRYLHRVIFSPPHQSVIEPQKVEEDLGILSAFSKEFTSETDRGAALVGAALVNTKLDALLPLICLTRR